MEHKPSTLEAWSALAAEAKILVEKRCNERDLRIDDIARALKSSPRRLQRAFDAEATDFTRELKEARMRRAVRILASDQEVTTAASSCGFGSPSHFCVAFKTYYQGTTPVQFKRASKLDRRLQWRAWKDEVDPVRPGSTEYFRRRKRWSADRLALERLVRTMAPVAQAALTETKPPPRPVLAPPRMQPRPVRPGGFLDDSVWSRQQVWPADDSLWSLLPPDDMEDSPW